MRVLALSLGLVKTETISSSEKYRTFAAMVDLDQFTVADVARASGVNIHTVRTVFARHRLMLRVVERKETGKRGGKYKKYEFLSMDSRNELSDECQSLLARERSQLGQSRVNLSAAELSLNSATDILRRQLPVALPEEMPDLFKSADLDLAICRRELEHADGRFNVEELSALTERLRGLQIFRTEVSAPVLDSVEAGTAHSVAQEMPNHLAAQVNETAYMFISSRLKEIEVAEPELLAEVAHETAAAVSERFPTTLSAATSIDLAEGLTGKFHYVIPEPQLPIFGREPAFFMPGSVSISANGRIVVDIGKFAHNLGRVQRYRLGEALLSALTEVRTFSRNYLCSFAAI